MIQKESYNQCVTETKCSVYSFCEVSMSTGIWAPKSTIAFLQGKYQRWIRGAFRLGEYNRCPGSTKGRWWRVVV
jgi:hypothetical protein